MWSCAFTAIPTGWILCDGTNNTPDLRDRFIVGAGNGYAVGSTGGEATHTLTVAEMPSHNHTFAGASHTHSTKSSGSTINLISVTNYGYGTDKLLTTNYNTSSYYESTLNLGAGVTIDAATAGGTVGYTGSGSNHENRPPYYALCFIMKQ